MAITISKRNNIDQRFQLLKCILLVPAAIPIFEPSSIQLASCIDAVVVNSTCNKIHEPMYCKCEQFLLLIVVPASIILQNATSIANQRLFSRHTFKCTIAVVQITDIEIETCTCDCHLPDCKMAQRECVVSQLRIDKLA